MGSFDKKKNKKPVQKKTEKKSFEKKSVGKQDSNSEAFEKAILELGGTKGDLKFLENVEDDQDLITDETDKEEVKTQCVNEEILTI